MNDKAFHRDAFIVGAIILIALLLWLWLTKGAGQTIASTTPTPAQQAPSYVFNVPGITNSYGPVTFPSASYEYPLLTAPQNLNYPGSPVASATAANCMCGCDGSGGTTTYVLQPPDFSSVYDSLFASVTNTAQAIMNAELNSLGYSEGVFVANATPTQFAGGSFPNY